jgi:hypothetical protein
MQAFSNNMKYLIFVSILAFITSCGKSSSTNINPNSPIIKILPNSGGATLIVPLDQLQITSGNISTSTSINLVGGTRGLNINLISSVITSASKVTLDSKPLVTEPVTVTFTPDDLIAGSIISSSIQININPNLPAGTYSINLYAAYLVNGTKTQVQIGSIILTYDGSTPTPTSSPTPTPSPVTPSPTPSPTPSLTPTRQARCKSTHGKDAII